jgi:galactose oxidase
MCGVQIFLIGGSWSGGLESNKDGEKFRPGGPWVNLPGAPVDLIRTKDPKGRFRDDNHSWLFAWSGAEGALCCAASVEHAMLPHRYP